MKVIRSIFKILLITILLTSFLYIFFLFIDMVTGYHLAKLLLNVDFMRDYRQVTLIEELFYHFFITLSILLVTLYINKKYKKVKPIYFSLLLVFFIALYPLMVAIAVRAMFKYDILEHILWVIGHALFLKLLDIALTKKFKN